VKHVVLVDWGVLSTDDRDVSGNLLGQPQLNVLESIGVVEVNHIVVSKLR
jgi:hypothetical protein